LLAQLRVLHQYPQALSQSANIADRDQKPCLLIYNNV
jgi:hypothetical protein